MNAKPGSTVDLQTTEAVEGVSFTYGIDYTFDYLKYLNLQSGNTAGSFVRAYAPQGNIEFRGLTSGLNVWLKSNTTLQPTKVIDTGEMLKIAGYGDSLTQGGTVSSTNPSATVEFGNINSYNRITSTSRSEEISLYDITTDDSIANGTAEPNADSSIKVGSDGKYSITIPKQAEGTKVTATGTITGTITGTAKQVAIFVDGVQKRTAAVTDGKLSIYSGNLGLTTGVKKFEVAAISGATVGSKTEGIVLDKAV